MYVAIREPHLIDAYGSTAAGAKELGLSHLEITISPDRKAASVTDGAVEVSLATDADIDAYKASLAAAGLNVSAMLVYNDFGAPDWEGQIEWMVCAIKLGEKLGGAVLRIDPIMSTDDWPLEKRVDRTVETISRILNATSGSSVPMAMENHGSQGNRPEFLDSVIGRVGSPRLGMNIDTANFYWYGFPLSKVHEIIRHFAPFTKHTHVKNINYPADKREIQREIGWEYGQYASPLREGNIDLPFVVSQLRKNGYQGDLCIEDESLGRLDLAGRRKVLQDDVAYVKSLL